MALGRGAMVGVGSAVIVLAGAAWFVSAPPLETLSATVYKTPT